MKAIMTWLEQKRIPFHMVDDCPTAIFLDPPKGHRAQVVLEVLSDGRPSAEQTTRLDHCERIGAKVMPVRGLTSAIDVLTLLGFSWRADDSEALDHENQAPIEAA